jgi:hypothetical protein
MRFRPKGGFGQNPQKPTAKPRRPAPRPGRTGRRRASFLKNGTSRKSSAPKTSPPACRRRANRKGTRRPGTGTAGKKFPRAATWKPRRGGGGKIRAGALQAAQRHDRQHQGAATNLVKKVQRLIRPEKKIHKEVIINAESLETRVAVLEDGKLEEFTIERTTEERLVGSIFKGKVRNLEDGLKAAFVDIGFEKNAFLHYWDIVPNQFDSGVEIVEREGRRPRPAAHHAEGHPAPLSARQRNHRAGHQRPHRHQRPARHHQPGAARTLPGAAAQFRPERHLAQDRKPGGTPAPQENPARTATFPTAWASSCAPPAKASRSAISSATSPAARRMERRPGKIKSQPPATCVFQEPDLIERTVRDFLTEDVERIVVDNQKAYDRMREMISRIKPAPPTRSSFTPSAADLRPVQHHQATGERLLAPGPFEERRLHRH